MPPLPVVIERWEEVVEAVRAAGRTMVAPLLSDAEPISVTGEGVLVLQVADETAETALSTASAEVQQALASLFPALRKVRIHRAGAPAARGRLTTESVVADRLASLRRKDPAIAEAIDELDLELLE